MWPGGQGSDAQTCGARLVPVGMRARPPPDGRPSRAVSGSVHGPYARMRARAVSVCMMEASTCQAQDRAVFSIHGVNVAEASATGNPSDILAAKPIPIACELLSLQQGLHQLADATKVQPR